MNYRMIKNVIGWILLFEAVFLLVPAITALAYAEQTIWSILISIVLCAVCGLLMIKIGKPKSKVLYSKDGFVIVALSWIVLSLFGALPFYLSGAIPDFVDALFETVSGFTTTGASILPEIESFPKSLGMWRSFTHWVGGMGVLVFIMAFLPLSGGQNMYIMKAESPGPSVSKLVPRVRTTALILYVLYFVLTLIMFIMLLCGGENVFDSLNLAFATAGTGGFGIRNDSMASFSSYTQIVVTVFMLIFSINFNSYYLILLRKFKYALNGEVRWFIAIVVLAIGSITLNIVSMFDTVGEALKHAAFTFLSII